MKMNIVKKGLTIVTLLICSLLSAQETPSYLSVQGVSNLSGTTSVNGGTITIPNTDKIGSGLQEYDVAANLYLKLDLGDDYIAIDNKFKIELTVLINSANSTSNITQITKTFSIDGSMPEVLIDIDLLGSVSSFDPSVSLTVNVSSLIIDDGDNTTNPPALNPGLLKNYIDNNLRLSATFVRKYAVDVRLASGLISASLNQTTVSFIQRRATFNWLAPSGVSGYPNYELQILRLYNTDLAKKDSYNDISAEVDWSKALRVETQSQETTIDLTLAEGTGFYIWRVRAIGNFYKGGIANHENYGQWSNSFPNGSTQLIKATDIGGINAASYGNTFYFEDPDQDINWIYNRVFTEGNNDPTLQQGVKTSEGMSYADGLLRARQTQAYNSSNNTTLVTQTVSDYSGRPALTTLPVPVNGGLENYQVGFVQNENGAVYTALDYDFVDDNNTPYILTDDTNYVSNPRTVTNSNFDYYSSNSVTIGTGQNNDNVADAEGFPFKRTLFKTDGTGRVDEESGVGRMHALGSVSPTGNGAGGKTTRVLFGSPSDEELIRIFGDEAPLSESVIKTITIDPNDVVSVTYTSKEGKTIATALITKETTDDDGKIALQKLENTITELVVHNIANQNVVSNQKMISSKRIVVDKNQKEITLDYTVTQGPLSEGCGSVDCKLEVRFFLTDLKSGKIFTSDANVNDAGLQPFIVGATGTSLSFPSVWGWADANPLILPFAPAIILTGNTTVFELDEGEYILTKEVYSANKSNFVETDIAELTDKLQPVLDAIADTMRGIDNAADYANFEIFITNFKTLVDAYQLLSETHANSIDLINFLNLNVPSSYVFPVEFSFNDIDASGNSSPITDPFANDQDNSDQNVFSFALSCCGTMEVPIPTPEICVPCEAINEDAFGSDFDGIDELKKENPNGTYFIANDGTHQTGWTEVNGIVEKYFMRFLYDKLVREGFQITYDPNDPAAYDPIGTQDLVLQATLDRFAPGFTPESLKGMITNMLVSRYYVGQSKLHTDDNKYYRAKRNYSGWLSFTDINGDTSNTTNGLLGEPLDDMPNLLSPITGINDGDEFNYTCKGVYDGWIQAVNLINAFDFDDDANVMNEYNDEEGSGESEEHYDDDDNSDGPGGLVGMISSFIISQKMRNFQNSPDGNVPKERLESLVNLPTMFMESVGVGTQFAAILDEDEAVANYPDYAIATPLGSTTPPITIPSGAVAGEYNFSSHAAQAPALFQVTKTPNGAGNPPIISLDPYTGLACPTSTVNTALQYKYILKPEWMFKYFVYNAFDNFTEGGTFSDADPVILNQFDVEMALCYNDVRKNCGPSPTDELPLCFGLECQYYHKNWSAAERATFYKQIRGSLNCPLDPSTTFSPADPINEVTKEELISEANQELDDAVAICENSAGDIKSALITELTNKCYTFVECISFNSPTYEIGEEQIDNMVKEVVKVCVAKIEDPLTGIRAHLPQLDVSDPLDPICINPAVNSGIGYGCINTIETDEPGTAFNQYPAILKEACNWIDGFGVCHQNTKQTVTLFAPCDLETLDHIYFWEFQPHLDISADLPQPLDNDGDPIDTNGDGTIDNKDKCPNAKNHEWVSPNSLVTCTTIGCNNTQTCTHTDEEGNPIINTYTTIKDIPVGGY